MATGEKWEQFFETATRNERAMWDEALDSLPRMVYDEFGFGVDAMRTVHHILKVVMIKNGEETDAQVREKIAALMNDVARVEGGDAALLGPIDALTVKDGERTEREVQREETIKDLTTRLTRGDD